MAKSYTDIVYQNVRLFIEGVELPFVSISITSGVGGLPSANITIPAQAGLFDIANHYSPKVHIFFLDRHGDYDPNNVDDDKIQYKLLFSGLIAQTSFHKSKNYGGSVGISFSCIHRYSLVSDMLVDYSGWLSADPLDPNRVEAAVKADTANSQATIIEALSGILGRQDDAAPLPKQEITRLNPMGKTSVLPSKYNDVFNRLIGMPGIMVNFWNQMKRSAFNRAMTQGDKYYSEAFVKIYQPLLEDGLMFFNRLGGHYPIEALIQNDLNRVEPCPKTPNIKDKILIPPMGQMFLPSAVQADMTISNISSYLQNSGEVTSIYGIFTQFYDSVEYEIVTLASPAEVAVAPGDLGSSAAEYTAASGASATQAIDTIVKPKLPFYFSPTCNVLFPGMYHTISVMSDQINVPTRINIKNMEYPGDTGYQTNFRAPPSIREAIVAKVAGVNGKGGYVKDRPYSLRSSIGPSYGAIGVYEQGRGVKLESMHLPRWLSLLSHSTYGASNVTRDAPLDATAQANKIAALKQLSIGWARRHPGAQSQKLNPFSVDDADVSAHHRILFAAADYYYTQVFARSKAGRVEGPFNPYIVPGYPMDILELNPTYPSFHALCTSVTHTITPESISTSIDFTAALTYAELANYYIPFVNPMLQVSLGLAENPTLVNSDVKAKDIADEFYKYTLGVPAATPDSIIDFTTMQIKPMKWDSDAKTNWVPGSSASVTGPNGGELNPMLSFEGNMSLTQRPIESIFEIESRFKINFVDMTMANYGSAAMKYQPSNLTDSTKFEIGESQFLTYDTFFGDKIPEQDPGTIDPNTGTGSGAVVNDTAAAVPITSPATGRKGL